MIRRRIYIGILAFIIVSFALHNESQSAVTYRYATMPYSWIELNGDADATNLNIDWDNPVAGTNVGFNFYFYETSYNYIYVCEKGYASFTYYSYDSYNDPIPTSFSPNNMICPFWDNQYANTYSTNGKVFYKVTGVSPARKLIVEWYQMDNWNGSTFTFEMILEEGTNNVIFQYNNMTGPLGSGGSASIGVENGSGTLGTQYCYNEAGKVSNGMALMLTYNTITWTPAIAGQKSYGSPLDVSWFIPQGNSISHTDVHYDTQSNPTTSYAFSTTPKSGTAGSYSDVINIYSSSYDTFYFVVHANIDGVDTYSSVMSCVYADSTGPGISGVNINSSPTNGAGAVNISGIISDTMYGCTNIVTAEYFINQGIGYTITPKNTPYDSSVEEFSLDLSTSDWIVNAEKKIYIRAQDAKGNWGATYTVKIEVTGKGGVFGDSKTPELFGVKISPNPTGGAATVKLTGTASDANMGGSNIGSVEYRHGSASATPYYAEAKDGEFNSNYEEFQKDIDASGFKAGEIILIYIRTKDVQDNWSDYQKVEVLTTIDTKARGAITYAYPNVATPTYPKVTFLIENPNNNEINIKIYNREGVMVREVKDKPYEWDKKDSAGAVVENGLYFYQIRIGEEIKSGKLVIVK